MKKIMALILSLMMLLGLTSVSMASTIYMDVMSGGEYENKSYYNDLSQIGIGFEVPLDDVTLSGIFTSGTREGYYDYDTSSFLLKGGYALVNDRQLRLDVTAGLYNRESDFYYEDFYTESYYSLMVGFDAKLKLDKKAWIDFSYAFGLTPKYDLEDDFGYIGTRDLDSISLLNCKLNLLLTREFGVSLGYTSETIDFKNIGKETYSGLTMGAFFKF